MITTATLQSIQLLTAELPLLAMPLAHFLMQRAVDMNQSGRAAALGTFRKIGLPNVHLGELGDALSVLQDIGDSGNRTPKAIATAQNAWMAIKRDRVPASIAFGYMAAVRKLCKADSMH